jgi:hypothetical protein
MSNKRGSSERTGFWLCFQGFTRKGSVQKYVPYALSQYSAARRGALRDDGVLSPETISAFLILLRMVRGA